MDEFSEPVDDVADDDVADDDGYNDEPATDRRVSRPVEDHSPARRVEREVAAEDGYMVVRLYTDRGEADFRVPPPNRWRSSARAAAFTRGDDLTWAMTTLTTREVQRWGELDPTGDDWNDFLAEVLLLSGQNREERRASPKSSRSGRGR